MNCSQSIREPLALILAIWGLRIPELGEGGIEWSSGDWVEWWEGEGWSVRGDSSNREFERGLSVGRAVRRGLKSPAREDAREEFCGQWWGGGQAFNLRAGVLNMKQSPQKIYGEYQIKKIPNTLRELPF